jgi:hypothetical protein
MGYKRVAIAASSVLAALALAASVAAIPAFAVSPKAGAKCTKAGVTQVVKTAQANKTIKFTCIKSGNKLVWNNGVTVKAAPVKSATPKPPTLIAIAEPNPPDPKSNDAIWLRVAQNIFNELLTMKPAKIQQINFINSPNAIKQNAQDFRDAYQGAMTYWSSFAVSDAPIKWLVVTEKDKDWWLNTMKPLADSNWNPGWWGSNHCDQASTTICGAGDTGIDGAPLFTGFVGTRSTWSGQNTVNALHEATHVYQKIQLGSYMNSMPCWYAEGQATLFGIALGRLAQPMGLSRAREFEELARQIPESTTWDASGWRTALKTYESFGGECQSTHFGYAVGYLVNEKLMDQFGHPKVLEWERLSARSQDWRTSFNKVFGQSVDDWYRDSAAAYIDSQAR